MLSVSKLVSEFLVNTPNNTGVSVWQVHFHYSILRCLPRQLRLRHRRTLPLLLCACPRWLHAPLWSALGFIQFNVICFHAAPRTVQRPLRKKKNPACCVSSIQLQLLHFWCITSDLAAVFRQDALRNHRCHSAVAQAYVADVTTPNERLRYLGLLGAAAGLAFILGPAIGGTLSSLFGYGVPSFWRRRWLSQTWFQLIFCCLNPQAST